MYGVSSQNTFSRVVYNAANMGGGSSNECFTDYKIVEALSELLAPPLDADGNELPSTWFDITCGDMSSLAVLANSYRCAKRTLFGCEARADVAAAAKKGFPQFRDNILNCDSSSELRMQNACISVGGLNPPYGDMTISSSVHPVRAERVFLEKITPYIMRGGLLVWVIPHRTFILSSFFSYLVSHYELLGVYKTVTTSDWFSHMSPVAIVARRVTKGHPGNDAITSMIAEYADYDSLMDIPEKGSVPMEERFSFPSFDEKDIRLFQTREFREQEVFEMLSQNDDESTDTLSSKIFPTLLVPALADSKLAPSPIPLKGAHKVLALIGSNTDCIEVGSEGKDKFLLRISVEQKENGEILSKADESGRVTGQQAVVRQSAVLSMTILEPDGNWIKPEMENKSSETEVAEL